MGLNGLICDTVRDACGSLRAGTALSGAGNLVEPSVASAPSSVSYASIVSSGSSKIRVSRGPALKIPRTANLIVRPKDESAGYATSREVRHTLEKIFKPSDFDLKVSKVSSARNNGVCIEALSVDLPKIRDSQILDRGIGAGAGIKSQSKITHTGRFM